MLIRRRRIIGIILVSTVCMILVSLHSILYTPKLAIDQRRYVDGDIKNKNDRDMATLSSESKKTCQRPISRVSFLKVHKAGSSTVMNIFLRYGESHKLNIALPVYTGQPSWNYLGNREYIRRERITEIPENETYHIICNHAIYNKRKSDEILGKNHANVAIIRNPTGGFVSAVSYYSYFWDKIRNYYGISKSNQELLSSFLMNPISTSVDSTGFQVQNSMFVDFGLQIRDYSNQTVINEHLHNIDKDFELVMLLENFDESLVLMKNKLCWTFKDILYVPMNINRNKKKNSLILTETDKNMLHKYNNADHQLYEFFNAKFKRQIKDAGEDFYRELQHFKHIMKYVTKYCQECASHQFNGSSVHTFPSSAWNEEFIITQEDCKFMMTNELDLLKQLWEKYKKRYSNWLIKMNKLR